MIRLCLALLLVLMTQAGEAVDPSVRPTEFVRNCTNSGCHSNVMEGAWVHGPTAAGACTSCHKNESEEEHTFRLSGNDKDMCGFCHMAQTTGGVHTHDPVAKGQCLACHDPHASNTRALQRARDGRSQCLECHKGILYEGEHMHTPVRDGECTMCHQAHSSEHAGLLTEPRNTLCMRCHEGVVHESLAGAALSVGGAVGPRAILGADLGALHPPQLEGCQTCHATHASDHASLLKNEPAKVCGECHAEIFERAMNATVPHSIVTEGRGCTNCHSPHGSLIGAMLRDHPTEACLECHDKELERPDGTPVGEVHDMTNARHKHGAVQLGRCRGCHEVHGSDHRSLLLHRYTPAFYQRFDLKEYALCFECHDSALVLTETTEAATGFRNGTRNLHNVHVATTEKAGRTCRACHATHTSDWPKLMQESVPYGEWEIPIKFEQTDSGGSCVAGCHKAKRYDRQEPVAYEPP